MQIGATSALPSRNYQVVNSNHTRDDVIVTLQQPQAELRLLPRCLKGYKLSICTKKKGKKRFVQLAMLTHQHPRLVNLQRSSIWISLPLRSVGLIKLKGCKTWVLASGKQMQPVGFNTGTHKSLLRLLGLILDNNQGTALYF